MVTSPKLMAPFQMALTVGTLPPMIPSSLLPMLATAGPLPAGEGWAYEVKWDGYRVLARVEGGRTTLRSRTGRDATKDYPEVELDLPDASSTASSWPSSTASRRSARCSCTAPR